MKNLISAVLVLLMSTNPSNAGCNKDGGDFPDCVETFARLPFGHEIPSGTYSSGGTFILKNAGCVSYDTKFRFHSAFFGEDEYHVKALSIPTNFKQLRMFEQYPRLQIHLVLAGAFNKVLPMTDLSGEDIHSLTGLPYC